jgi:hypothetical protein
MDGGTNLRMAGGLPAVEQGPGEEHLVIEVVHQVVDNSFDAQPT